MEPVCQPKTHLVHLVTCLDKLLFFVYNLDTAKGDTSWRAEHHL